MLRCIFCGLCEEACPKQAIYLRHDEFVPVFTERDQVIWGKDLLAENMNNRYLRKAWTKEEAHEQDLKGVEAQPRTQL